MDSIASNDDIIMEILLRLPAKTVTKFKLVSKKWLHLISDPNFTLRHSHHNAKSTVSGFILASVFCFKMPPTYTYVSLDENENSTLGLSICSSFDPKAPGPTLILQSCHGLLLCYSQLQFYGPRYGSCAPCKYYIFNPATNRFSIIPEPTIDKTSIHSYYSLAYDPTISSFYHVVCFQFHIYNSSCNVQIYSSETKVWRNSGNHDSSSFSANYQHAVYWNGGIHWINAYHWNLTRFDIERENFQAMPRPPLPEDWNPYNFKHFMESQGHLFYIDFGCPEYIIYELENDFSKWTVKYRLDINLIVSAFSDDKTSSNSLLEMENSVSLISLVEVKNEGPSLVMDVPGKVISYRLKDNTLKTVCDVMLLFPVRFCWYRTFNYMETLCCV